MSDFLVELGANPTARQIIKTLGLPLPVPQKLHRTREAWEARPLEGQTVIVGGSAGIELGAVLSRALAEAGATTLVEGAVAGPWAAAAEAWGQPVRSLPEGQPPEGRVHGLVFDATGLTSLDELDAMYRFFQPRLKAMGTSGRIVVLGRPASDTTVVETSSARRGLEGFVRSLAKEVGGKGITANLVTVGRDREEAVGPLLRWMLSPRSAFVTGQPLALAGKIHPPAAIPWARPLDGKVAIVTGAARGIGEATAIALAREGAHVLCVDRPNDAEPLAEVAQRIGGTPVLVDVTASDAAQGLLAAVRQAGGLDILVHNAGITRDKTLANMDEARWKSAIDVNLRAVLHLTEALLPAMRDQGRIVCLASVAGIAGNFGQTNYALSKAGVIGFVEAQAPKLIKRGITVNAIAPGFIETRLTAAIPAATREAGRRLSALVQGGLPSDIAETVTWLASPGAYGMTGRIVRVCGGAFIGA